MRELAHWDVHRLAHGRSWLAYGIHDGVSCMRWCVIMCSVCCCMVEVVVECRLWCVAVGALVLSDAALLHVAACAGRGEEDEQT